MPERLLARLRTASRGRLCMLGVNTHIERFWQRSLECYAFCRCEDVPAYIWAHDYWPHHEPSVRLLVRELGANLLASTETVRDGLANDGFSAEVVQVGISFANVVGDAYPSMATRPFVVGSAGRLVPRKRMLDVVRAFGRAGSRAQEQLHLRLLPSLVNSSADDDALFTELAHEATLLESAGSTVLVHRTASEQHDYRPYSIYVCASEYEGFSMTPIEAIYCGRPALMSDIPAHREIAAALSPDDPFGALFAPRDVDALADLLRDEALTGRRRAGLHARWDEIRDVIETRWSLRGTARTLLDVLTSFRPRSGDAQHTTNGAVNARTNPSPVQLGSDRRIRHLSPRRSERTTRSWPSGGCRVCAHPRPLRLHDT